MKKLLIASILFLSFSTTYAENGYDLWLRYLKITHTGTLVQYKKLVSSPALPGSTPTLLAAKEELQKGLNGMLGYRIPISNSITVKSNLVIGIAGTPSLNLSPENEKKLITLGREGFLISSDKKNNGRILITANSDIGVLYGVFHFLRLMQTQQDLRQLEIGRAHV